LRNIAVFRMLFSFASANFEAEKGEINVKCPVCSAKLAFCLKVARATVMMQGKKQKISQRALTAILAKCRL
jgi:hypothetical protein